VWRSGAGCGGGAGGGARAVSHGACRLLVAEERVPYFHLAVLQTTTSTHTHSWAFPHVGANGVSLPPGKMDEKLKSENMQKRAVFKCLCYILRSIGAGRCREWRYADHIFIQIYRRMHHFVVKFSKFSSPQAARGH